MHELAYRIGYDRQAPLFQTPLTLAAFIGAYVLASPEANINWVYGPNEPRTLCRRWSIPAS